MGTKDRDLERLFSYGTLQLESVQIDTFGRKLDGRSDAVVGYEVTLIPIRDEAVVAELGETHYRNIRFTGDQADVVEGLVLEVSEEELVEADAYEADADYVRVVVRLRSGIDAWVYLSSL